MQRKCSRCDEPFTAKDLSKEESKELEGERKAHGMQGMRFLYYTCSRCGQADIFVDILQLDNESSEEFAVRRGTLEDNLANLHGEGADLVVQSRKASDTNDGIGPFKASPAG